MGRRLAGKLVIATHNKGKLDEFRALMEPHGIAVTSVGELGLPSPEETGETFRENALIKALAAVSATNLPCLADDSGLCVEALGGEPGIHTADWAGPGRDWLLAMTRVEERLADLGAVAPESRRGTFVSYLCLVWPDGHTEEFEGRVAGTLVWPPRGAHGHGYDPMFQPDGKTITFAEMSEDEKNRISHRARSFALFAKACLAESAAG
jgi:XTP/dITP diphosphohydrolase